MTKRIVAIILAVLLSFSVLAIAEDLNKTMYVRAFSGLNLRSAPDLEESEVVVAMLFNGKVTVHEYDETGLFAHVSYTNLGVDYDGWCWADYLSKKITKIVAPAAKPATPTTEEPAPTTIAPPPTTFVPPPTTYVPPMPE